MAIQRMLENNVHFIKRRVKLTFLFYLCLLVAKLFVTGLCVLLLLKCSVSLAIYAKGSPHV